MIYLLVAKLRLEFSFPDSPGSLLSFTCHLNTIQYNTIEGIDNKYMKFSLSFNVLPVEKYSIFMIR